MQINNWRDAEDCVQHYFNNLGKESFCYKITDTAEVNRGSKGKKVIAKAVPSDFIVTINGSMFYLEVKYCSDEKSFNFSNFTKTELVYLKKQTAAHGIYFVYVYSSHLKKWFATTGTRIINLMDEGKRSVKFKEMLPLNMEI